MISLLLSIVFFLTTVLSSFPAHAWNIFEWGESPGSTQTQPQEDPYEDVQRVGEAYLKTLPENSAYRSMVGSTFVLPYTPHNKLLSKEQLVDEFNRVEDLESSKKELALQSTKIYLNQALFNMMILEHTFGLRSQVAVYSKVPVIKDLIAPVQTLWTQEKKNYPQASDAKAFEAHVTQFNAWVGGINEMCSNANSIYVELMKAYNNKILQDPEWNPKIKDLLGQEEHKGYYVIEAGGTQGLIRKRLKQLRAQATLEAGIYQTMMSQTMFGKLYNTDTNLRNYVGSFNTLGCVEYGHQLKVIPTTNKVWSILNPSIEQTRAKYQETLADLSNKNHEDATDVLKQYMEENPATIQQALIANPKKDHALIVAGLIANMKRNGEIKEGVLSILVPITAIATMGASLAIEGTAATVMTLSAIALNGYFVVSTIMDLSVSYDMEKRIEQGILSDQINPLVGQDMLENIKSSRPFSYVNLVLSGLGLAAASARAIQIAQRVNTFKQFNASQGGSTAERFVASEQNFFKLRVKEFKPLTKVEMKELAQKIKLTANERPGMNIGKPDPFKTPEISGGRQLTATEMQNVKNWLEGKPTQPTAPKTPGNGPSLGSNPGDVDKLLNWISKNTEGGTTPKTPVTPKTSSTPTNNGGGVGVLTKPVVKPSVQTVTKPTTTNLTTTPKVTNLSPLKPTMESVPYIGDPIALTTQPMIAIAPLQIIGNSNEVELKNISHVRPPLKPRNIKIIASNDHPLQPDNQESITQKALAVIQGQAMQYDIDVMREICKLQTSHDSTIASAAQKFAQVHDLRCSYADITPEILNDIARGKMLNDLNKLRRIRRMMLDYMNEVSRPYPPLVGANVTSLFKDDADFTSIEHINTTRKFSFVPGNLSIENEGNDLFPIDFNDTNNTKTFLSEQLMKLSNELWMIPIGFEMIHEQTIMIGKDGSGGQHQVYTDPYDTGEKDGPARSIYENKILQQFIQNIEIQIRKLIAESNIERPMIGFIQKPRDLWIDLPPSFSSSPQFRGTILNQSSYNIGDPSEQIIESGPAQRPVRKIPRQPGKHEKERNPLPLTPKKPKPNKKENLSTEEIINTRLPFNIAQTITSDSDDLQSELEKFWKEQIVPGTSQTYWQLIQEALNGGITFEHIQALKQAKEACDKGEISDAEFCHAVEHRLAANRYAELKTFPIEPAQFSNWWEKNLKFITKNGVPIEDPLTEEEHQKLISAIEKDFEAAIKIDPFALSNIPHLNEHGEHADLFASEIQSLGISISYYKRLAKIYHDAGKLIPSLNVKEYAYQHFTTEKERFTQGRIMLHDQSTVEYLLQLGERLSIAPEKMEHLILDIMGHNDGSELEDIFWNKNYKGPYGRPARLIGYVLALFDRYGQGNWTGARKILPNTVQDTFFGKVENAFYTSPKDTIRQLNIIYHRALGLLKFQNNRTANAEANLKKMFDYAVAAQQNTINGYLHLNWNQEKATFTIEHNGHTYRATDLNEFLNSDFQQALEASSNSDYTLLDQFLEKPGVMTDEIHRQLIKVCNLVYNPLYRKAKRYAHVAVLQNKHSEFYKDEYPEHDLQQDLENWSKALNEINNLSKVKLSTDQIKILAQSINKSFFINKQWGVDLNGEITFGTTFAEIYARYSLIEKPFIAYLFFIWDETGKPYFYFNDVKFYRYKSKIYPLEDLARFNKLTEDAGFQRTFDDVLHNGEYHILKRKRIGGNKELQTIDFREFAEKYFVRNEGSPNHILGIEQPDFTFQSNINFNSFLYQGLPFNDAGTLRQVQEFQVYQNLMEKTKQDLLDGKELDTTQETYVCKLANEGDPTFKAIARTYLKQHPNVNCARFGYTEFTNLVPPKPPSVTNISVAPETPNQNNGSGSTPTNITPIGFINPPISYIGDPVTSTLFQNMESPWNQPPLDPKKWEELYKIHHFQPSTLAKTEMDLRNNKLIGVDQYFFLCYLAANGMESTKALALAYIQKHKISCVADSYMPFGGNSGTIGNSSSSHKSNNQAVLAILGNQLIFPAIFQQILRDSEKNTTDSEILRQWLTEFKNFLEQTLEIKTVDFQKLIQTSTIPDFKDERLQKDLKHIRLFNELDNPVMYARTLSLDQASTKVLIEIKQIKGTSSYEAFYNLLGTKLNLYSSNEIFNHPEIKQLHLNEYDTWSLILGVQPLIFLFQDYQWIQKNINNLQAINDKFKTHFLSTQIEEIQNILQKSNGLDLYRKMYTYFGAHGEWPTESQIMEIQLNGVQTEVESKNENEMKFYDIILKMKNDPAFRNHINDCLKKHEGCKDSETFKLGFETSIKQEKNRERKVFPVDEFTYPEEIYTWFFENQSGGNKPLVEGIYAGGTGTDYTNLGLPNLVFAASNKLNGKAKSSIIIEATNRYYTFEETMDNASYFIYSPYGFEIYRVEKNVSGNMTHYFFYAKEGKPPIVNIDFSYLDKIKTEVSDKFIRDVQAANPESVQFFQNLYSIFTAKMSVMDKDVFAKMLYYAYKNPNDYHYEEYQKFFTQALSEYPLSAQIILTLVTKPNVLVSKLQFENLSILKGNEEKNILNILKSDKISAEKIGKSHFLGDDKETIYYVTKDKQKFLLMKKDPQITYAGYLTARDVLNINIFEPSILIRIEGTDYFVKKYTDKITLDLILPNGSKLPNTPYTRASELAQSFYQAYEAPSKKGLYNIYQNGILSFQSSDELKFFDYLMSMYMRSYKNNTIIYGNKYNKEIKLTNGQLSISELGEAGKDYQIYAVGVDHSLEEPSAEIFLWPSKMINEPQYLNNQNLVLSLKINSPEKLQALLEKYLTQSQLDILIQNRQTILNLNGIDESKDQKATPMVGTELVLAKNKSNEKNYTDAVNHLSWSDRMKWAKLLQDAKTGTTIFLNESKLIYAINVITEIQDETNRLKYLHQIINSQGENLYSPNDFDRYQNDLGKLNGFQQFVSRYEMLQFANRLIDAGTIKFDNNTLSFSWNEKNKTLILYESEKFDANHSVEFIYTINVESLKLSADGGIWGIATDHEGQKKIFSIIDPKFPAKNIIETLSEIIDNDKAFDELNDLLISVLRENGFKDIDKVMGDLLQRIYIAYDYRDVLETFDFKVEGKEGIFTAKEHFQFDLGIDFKFTPEQIDKVTNKLEQLHFFRPFTNHQLDIEIANEWNKSLSNKSEGGLTDYSLVYLGEAAFEKLSLLDIKTKNNLYLLIRYINENQNFNDGTTRLSNILEDFRNNLALLPVPENQQDKTLQKYVERFISSFGLNAYSPQQEKIDRMIQNYFINKMVEPTDSDIQNLLKKIPETIKSNASLRYDPKTNEFEYFYFNIWTRTEKKYSLDIKGAKKTGNGKPIYWVPLVNPPQPSVKTGIFLEVNYGMDQTFDVFDCELHLINPTSEEKDALNYFSYPDTHTETNETIDLKKLNAVQDIVNLQKRGDVTASKHYVNLIALIHSYLQTFNIPRRIFATGSTKSFTSVSGGSSMNEIGNVFNNIHFLTGYSSIEGVPDQTISFNEKGESVLPIIFVLDTHEAVPVSSLNRGPEQFLIQPDTQWTVTNYKRIGDVHVISLKQAK